ncbi:MAG: DNA polymerase III subunit delta [Pyrinomonadaceae bacterium]
MYVLFGPETHLRDLAAKTIVNLSFGDGDLRDFNESSFSLNTEGNLQRAIAAAQQLPMMASRRVITLTELRISATGVRDTITEQHESAISAYLNDPSPHAVLIFVADELNGVRKMGKLLREKAVAVEFKSLDERDMAVLARRIAAKAGAEIDDTTVRQLIARIGPDVNRLTNELNKLAAAAMPSGRITADLIEALVPNSHEISNFDLTDHLVAGRRAKALSALKKILDDGGEPLALLGLISYNYRRLLMAKDLMSRGADRGEVAKVVKLRYSDQEPFLAAARRADLDRLTHAISRLADTDVAIKTSIGGSGPAGARQQLEILVCELATLS